MSTSTTLRRTPFHLVAATALLLYGACSNEPVKTGSPGTGGSGSGSSGSTGTSPGTAGETTTGTAGDTGASGSTGSAASGTAGTTDGTAGSTAGAAGVATGLAGASGGTGGATAGASGVAGMTGAGGGMDQPPPHPLNVTSTKAYNGNGLHFDPTKTPVMGKLVLYLGGICGGTGAGGIEAFVNMYGFHTYAPATQTCVNGGDNNHAPYRANLTSTDPAKVAEANRIVGDARMELWDGVDRVPFVTVAPGKSIQDETIAALKAGMMADPGSDWGYFLSADGATLRTSDIYVVGYSWGSQTWGMISSYVRFGRVICTSGPQAEGFPNADWILKPGPNRTPPDRQFTLLGFNADYPSMDKLDTAPNTVTSMIDTTTKAGWLGPPINVHPGDMGPFTPGHQIAMVEPPPYTDSPGGHTVFCTNNPKNGWLPVCRYVFGVK
jgi:hypothetical protein